MNLSTPLYTAKKTRQLDQLAISSGIAGIDLMERAGAACMRTLRARWPECGRPLVLCGAGNNAGDGYIIARLCKDAGMRPTVRYLVPPEKLKGDAAIAAKRFFDAHGSADEYVSPEPEHDLIVDALLGTGLDRVLDGTFADAVNQSNASGLPILAVDIPTGLGADSGRVFGTAMRCAATVTFIGRKQGLYTGQARAYTGTIEFDDLAVPEGVYEQVPPSSALDGRGSIRSLPRRGATAHKGTNGRVLILGGNQGMPGSVRLSGEAALRVGAGLVRVATHERHADAIALQFPPLMSSAVMDVATTRRWCDWADALVLGPGLGTDDWASMMMEAASVWKRPVVVDADALNLLPRNQDKHPLRVLTPHPGEAARLLDTDIQTVEADRFAAARAIVNTYGGVCVLKGAGTIVANAEAIFVNALGNPGMATAGTGDALAGVIGALLARGHSPLDAARIGVSLHGRAGDIAAEEGIVGMTSLDLVNSLRAAANGR